MNTPVETERPVVYIVDDEEIVRRALKRLFKRLDRDALAFPSAKEFLADYRPDRPGCLVLDLYMPEMNGLELLTELNARSIDLPVIMLTGHGHIKTAVQAIKAGAADFVEKPVDENELIALVVEAISDNATKRSENEQEFEIKELLGSLTSREREVLRLIVAGELSKEIAHSLNLSEKTIEFHRTKILKKLRAKSLADLVRKSMIGGLN